jgi:hypothetical protein
MQILLLTCSLLCKAIILVFVVEISMLISLAKRCKLYNYKIFIQSQHTLRLNCKLHRYVLSTSSNNGLLAENARNQSFLSLNL